MNVYDSDRMTDVLAPLGYAPTDMADGADMVILNTCHIREKASEKCFPNLADCANSKNAPPISRPSGTMRCRMCGTGEARNTRARMG